jgi:hypothetical protein
MTDTLHPDEALRQPLPVALGYCLANWLVPGVGFLLARDWARGIGILVLINGVFLLGLVFDGYMTVPAMSPRDPSFNIFAALTFIVQLWHGGGVLAVFGAESMGGALAGLLVRDPGGAYSDLGAFHFAVAGGLNYFATVRLYDLMRSGDERAETPDDEPAEGAARPQSDSRQADDYRKTKALERRVRASSKRGSVGADDGGGYAGGDGGGDGGGD